ncbi:MAG: ATP phosphoribosyltransferase regulatory subunit [Christensenellaceae bacterium]|jgi:ATP phosphoribosyltransferase regulatory subunit
MNRYNKNIPEGTRDILYEDAARMRDIAARFSAVYESEGFSPIMTPALEYYDTFDYTGQSIRQEEMYKLTDNYGRLIVLRPDNTTPTARIIATKLKEAPLPLKLYYNQNVYRINADYSGRRSEFMQSGIEFAGINGVKSDLFCLSTALKTLSALELDFKIEIGHVGFSEALIASLALSTEEAATVRDYVNTKNTVMLGFLKTEKDLTMIKQLPMLYGGEEVLEKAAKIGAGNEEALRALETVRMLYKSLNESAFKGRIMIDLGITRSIEYYTGVVFRGYIEGSGEAVLSGGRYDKLIRSFDYDIPATGFAINVCMVADALKDKESIVQQEERKCLIHFSVASFGEAEAWQKALQKEGYATEFSCFGTLEETLAYAKKANISYVADVKKGETPLAKEIGVEI